jgi:isopenicillin N synthase-like dioxygenase
MSAIIDKPRTIPVVDIQPFFDGAQAGRRRVAAEVQAACEGLGFLVVTGHGVADSIVDALYAQATAFFDLSLDEKNLIRKPAGTACKGYGAIRPWSCTTARWSGLRPTS